MRIFIAFLLSTGLLLLMTSCGNSKKENYSNRMAEEHQGDKPVTNASKTYQQQQPVDTMSVDYAKVNGHAVNGYYAQPKDSTGDLPGIIVIHEWWGLNDNIRMMTRRFAGLGYKALAIDLYNGKSAESPNQARTLMQKSMNHKSANIENLTQAYQYLNMQKKAGQIGVIGWCFGGGWSLQTALALPDKIDATVIYYGQLVTDKAQLKPLQMPILAFFGGKDNSISSESINTFKSNLNALGKNVQVKVYKDANHAFANPSGTRYNKQAAQDAWNKTKAFFEKNLK